MTEQRPQRVADSIHKKGIRMKRTPTPIRLIGALAILGLSSAGQAATFSLVAVAVNGEPITPTDFVTVRPGDVIECEIHITGWADDNWCPICCGSNFQACSSDADCPEGCREFLLRFYQATIDPAGYVSGESGVLQPIGWDSHDPKSGAYIDQGRSDFVLFGFDEIVITAVAVQTLTYRYGGLLFDSGVVDIGQTAYAGTLLLAVSDADDLEGEACGSFVVTFLRDFFAGFTFLTSKSVGSSEAELVPGVAPLTINVGEDGACIYPDQACVEACEVTQATCAAAGGLWNPGRSCPDRFGPGDAKRGPASRDE